MFSPRMMFTACARVNIAARSCFPKHSQVPLSSPLKSTVASSLGPTRTFKSLGGDSPSKKPNKPSYILTLSCNDQPGIVHQVSGFLATRGLNILQSNQFGDFSTSRFFMRVHFSPKTENLHLPPNEFRQTLRTEFAETAQRLNMDWQIHEASERPRVLIMVSKIGHCLNDLLYRTSSQQLPIDIPLIVSNHPTFKSLANTYEVPFHHLPITPETKAQQEAEIIRLVDEHNIDFIVLARYMQVLSPELCKKMSGRIINIHHSFLPSFKGAKPYHQAFDRGVKLIGATAHFVTQDLDEGPIIEQGVDRVDHSLQPLSLTHVGSNVECSVLARAVKWVAERRVIMNGHKTVVFDS